MKILSNSDMNNILGGMMPGNNRLMQWGEAAAADGFAQTGSLNPAVAVAGTLYTAVAGYTFWAGVAWSELNSWY